MADLLRIENLSVTFPTPRGDLLAVREATIALEQGEVTAIVGESGCGKSVSAKAALGLLGPQAHVAPESRVWFGGHDVLAFDKREWREYRKACSIVFQDALAALDPTMSIGRQITEKLRLHTKMSRREAKQEAERLLALVEIPSPHERMRQYPHELSGGMRQRVMMAIALACDPELLVADEPTTALDVTVQAQIIDTLRQIQQARGMTVAIITHDLGIVANFASRVVVMYAGQVVETGSADDIFYRAAHPYTQALLRAVPRPDADLRQPLEGIEGSLPDMTCLPAGCAFAPRCPLARPECSQEGAAQKMRPVGVGHECRCVRANEDGNVAEKANATRSDGMAGGKPEEAGRSENASARENMGGHTPEGACMPENGGSDANAD